MIFKREAKEVPAGQDAADHAAGADGARRRRDRRRTSPTRRSAPGTFQLDAKKKFFQPHRVVGERRRRLPSHAGSERLLHLLHGTAAGSSPTTATTTRATPATSSRRWRRRRTAFRTSRRSSRASWRRSIRRSSASATRRGSGWSRGSTTSSSADVEDVVRLTPTIVEVIVKAPAAARHFQPGQFYRLQNFESVAPRVRDDSAPDGRHRADRRVGRQGARPAVADRARAGRVEPARARTCRRASRSS